MLLRNTISALFLVTVVATANASVDLTPSPAEYTAEGVKVQQLIFKDDNQSISYSVPPGWTYRFDDATIVLSPPKKAFAEATIQALPLPKPQPFDDTTIQKLEQQVLSTLPPGSEAVSIVKRERNSVLLNNNSSFEIIASYKTIGETFQRSVLFVNAPGTQLIFKLSARKGDFEALYTMFRGSVLTWQWLDGT